MSRTLQYAVWCDCAQKIVARSMCNGCHPCAECGAWTSPGPLCIKCEKQETMADEPINLSDHRRVVLVNDGSGNFSEMTKAEHEYIASPFDKTDIDDLRWLIAHGEHPEGNDDYRMITVVGLKKLLRHLTDREAGDDG